MAKIYHKVDGHTLVYKTQRCSSETKYRRFLNQCKKELMERYLGAQWIH